MIRYEFIKLHHISLKYLFVTATAYFNLDEIIIKYHFLTAVVKYIQIRSSKYNLASVTML